MKTRLNLELIKNYPKEHSISIKQFCLNCGISYATYRKIVCGKTNVRIDAVYGLAIGLKEDRKNLFIE